MLAADMNMGATDRSLEDRPEAFERVHVDITPSIFFGPVVDRVVLITKARQDFIRSPFVGTDARSPRHLPRDLRDKRLARSIGHDLGIKLAVTLKDR